MGFNYAFLGVQARGGFDGYNYGHNYINSGTHCGIPQDGISMGISGS